MGNELPKIEVGYGLASVYSDGIEINRKITGELKDKILKHEMRHGRNRVYSIEDYKNDFQSSNSYFKDSFILALKNPEMLIGFFPIMYSYYFKAITFNWSSLPPFLFFGVIFSVFWWLIFKVSVLESFVCYLVIVLVMNLILLGLTHYIVKKSGYDY